MEKRQKRPEAGRSLRFLLSAILWMVLCACDNSLRSTNTAKETEFTTSRKLGTFSGQVIEGELAVGGDGYTARLLRCDSARVLHFVKATAIGVAGDYVFDSLSTSEYVVEVWKNDDLRGRTSLTPFVDSVDQRLFVFLVSSIQKRRIDLRPLGSIDSVYVEYRENAGILVDGKWEVQTLQDTGFVVHSYLSAPQSRWEAWFYMVRAGKTVLVNALDQRALEIVQDIDSADYQLGPHVVALWDFDTLVRGRAYDRSDFDNNLVLSGGASLVPSPRGKALKLTGVATASGVGDVADVSLWLETSGMMTYQLRLKVDSSDLGNTILSASPMLGVAVYPNGKLLIGGQTTKDGQAKWFNLFSQVRIPFGEWIELTISCDMKDRQIYAWLGSMPVPLYVMDGWGSDQSQLRGDMLDVYELGSTSQYRDVVSFELDELRVSDTLVLGKGYPVQPANRVVSNLATDSSVILGLALRDTGLQIDAGMDDFFVGVDSADLLTARLVVKPRIPGLLQGKTILTAQLTTFDAAEATSGDMMMELCPIGSAWDEDGNPMDWVGASPNFDASKLSGPCMKAKILENSTGALRFDITDLLQGWVSGKVPMHGVVIKSANEDRDMGKELISSDSYNTYKVTLEAVYR